MGKRNFSAGKGCAILAGITVGIPLLIVGVVGVKTWAPLERAGDAMEELDRTLGHAADYVPAASGEIPAERMELFLELRAALVTACDDYGTVQKGFDSVAELESKDSRDPKEVGGTAVGLGGAALSITPFLARFFELRNDALLAASMGLQEYVYIYAAAYHDRLLSASTRREIFSDGRPLSPEASELLQGCLMRQLEVAHQAGGDEPNSGALEAELKQMKDDATRLMWQDGLPDGLQASVAPYRDRLEPLFCPAAAGLEMERGARRALRIALE